MRILLFLPFIFGLTFKDLRVDNSWQSSAYKHKPTENMKERAPASVNSPKKIFFSAQCMTSNGAQIFPGHPDFNNCFNNMGFLSNSHDIKNPSKFMLIAIPINE